jgi:hypothetical protein
MYDRVAASTHSPESKHIAYVAESGNNQFVVAYTNDNKAQDVIFRHAQECWPSISRRHADMLPYLAGKGPEYT